MVRWGGSGVILGQDGWEGDPLEGKESLFHFLHAILAHSSQILVILGGILGLDSSAAAQKVVPVVAHDCRTRSLQQGGERGSKGE